MATYPDDATAPVTAFSAVTDVQFTNTGATTDFNLGATVAHRGEVTAFVDGVLQATSTYDISNSGATVSFLSAPNASNVTLKTISVPARFRINRTFPAVRSIEYSNSTSQIINSNTYVINANTVAFALPEGVNVSSATDFMVFLSGVFQSSNNYRYPSTVLGTDGIDIADNSATKLLLNFQGNLTDDSDSSHTVTSVPGGGSFSGSGQTQVRLFPNGVPTLLKIPSSDDFQLTNRSFTLDTVFQPDSGTSMTSNQSLVSMQQDNNHNFNFRVVGANSNVGFVMNSGDNVTELYGGNANGGVSYHVAVSYDHNESNLRLYVNNVKVAHTNFNTGNTVTGDLVIGSNGTHSANGEYLSGSINFVRLAHAARYRSDGITPLNDLIPDKMTGAPLGAIDSSDELSIRVFDASVTTTDRFTSMADRKPDGGFSSERSFDAVIFESQAGYEKRKLRSRRPKRKYSLKYTNVTGVEKTAIENFYNARSGQFESFTFDLSHLNESGTINTRFDGSLKVDHVLSAGTALTENFFTVSFNLQETFD